jgi:hypothetical protein
MVNLIDRGRHVKKNDASVTNCYAKFKKAPGAARQVGATANPAMGVGRQSAAMTAKAATETMAIAASA